MTCPYCNAAMVQHLNALDQEYWVCSGLQCGAGMYTEGLVIRFEPPPPDPNAHLGVNRDAE